MGKWKKKDRPKPPRKKDRPVWDEKWWLLQEARWQRWIGKTDKSDYIMDELIALVVKEHDEESAAAQAGPDTTAECVVDAAD